MFDTLNTHIDVKNPPNLPLSFHLLFYIIYEVFIYLYILSQPVCLYS